ncbi:hypothetical protein CCC_00828 [Paramagnetospirillum magnetotacticum MS-1]|uniref:Uncharacterized protein n=1 Tax=Paramagnetospirillum magnetotacticum MS-1 TaxID=272627 RepID=A0A0C2U8D7_PARME|nr:class I SAM-dependent methyltransferase [Paramagnetospirillum magnetotacticum]KIL97767.1 hypothetical protein CCC_00828 [Paramagnetospirillum magnetotacticum MS-1]
MTRPDRCLICGAPDAQLLLAADQPDSYERRVGVTEDGFARAWVRCTGCGFHYSRYSRDPQILDRLYEDGYRDAAAAWRGATTEEVFRKVIALPDDQSETRARIRWIKQGIAQAQGADLIHWPAAPWRMVDVGGATGIMAYEFRDSQWLPHVVDPAPEGRFVEAYGIPYIQAPFRAGLLDAPVQMASLVYVLEHLRDPEQALRDVASGLAPDGLVFIEVPDALAFGRKPAEDDIFNSCHLWLFDPVSLLALLARTGFEALQLARIRTIRGHYTLMVLAKASA